MPSPLALALECASVALLLMVSGLIVFVPYTPPHDCESPISSGNALNVDDEEGIGGDGTGSEMEEDGSFFRTVVRWEAVRREDCLNWSRAWASDNNAKNNHNDVGFRHIFAIELFLSSSILRGQILFVLRISGQKSRLAPS